MITQEQAIAIVDKLLYEENGTDEWAGIASWTQDLQYGWLIKHAEKAFRDTGNRAYLRQRYGGVFHIIDKDDGRIWKIPASFDHIEKAIATYLDSKSNSKLGS